MATISETVQKEIFSSGWEPMWIVEDNGTVMGIVVDDHCFVALSVDTSFVQETWVPTHHIPHFLAKKIGQLTADGVLLY